MKHYTFTLIGMVLALIVLFSALFFKIDLFEVVHSVLSGLEKYEADEFIIPVVIFSVFSLFDQIRRQRLKKIEDEKIKIYEAMMHSTHHILNNFLNQMLLFKMSADNTPDFDPEILSLYDVVINDATAQIKALGNIASIDEVSIYESVKPK